MRFVMAPVRCLQFVVLLAMLALSAFASTDYSNVTCECPSAGCPNQCDSELYVCSLSQTSEPTSAAGIGGGGMIIPLLLIINQFPPYYGVPLSVTSIVGGSIIRFIVQVLQFHPEVRQRRLIDFPLVMLLLPSTLCGTVIGVLMNSISPTWLIVLIILFVLGYATYETFKKAFSLRQQEGLRVANGTENNDDDDDDPLLASVVAWPQSHTRQVETLALTYQTGNGANDEDEERAQLSVIMRGEGRLPLNYLGVSVLFLGLLLLLSLLRGGRSKTKPSFAGVTCGSTAYILLICSQFVLCILAAGVAMLWVRRQFIRKVQLNYPFVKGDVYYTNSRILMLPLATTLAGFLAGFLGVGAGMIIGPFLLSLGLLPTVSAATTSFMTLFTSSSSTVQYIALGRVKADYGILLFFLAMVASYVGQRFIVGPIRKRNKTSLLVMILGGIIGGAAILLCVTGTMQILQDYHQGTSFGFKALCE